MKKDDILNAWISSKISKAYRMSLPAYNDIENAEITDTAPSWFLECDGCKTLEEWIKKYPGTVKPFDYRFTPFHWFREASTSVRIIQYNGRRLTDLLMKVELSSLDGNDFEAIETITAALDYQFGFFHGYHTKVMQVKQPYINGPGSASREAGEWTLKEARKVLEKYGGLAGYKALHHGEKKPVIEEIEKAIKAKDPRNVHNLLKKLESPPGKN